MILDKLIRAFKKQGLKEKANEITAKTICDRTMTPDAAAIADVLINKRDSAPSAEKIRTD